jgi:glutaredoxin
MATVVVYTQPGCGACQSEKAWLVEKGVAYEDRDIRKDAKWLEELVELGSRGTPTTIVERDGEERQVLIGFDPQKLSQALQLH